jgi:hypothetical protein
MSKMLLKSIETQLRNYMMFGNSYKTRLPSPKLEWSTLQIKIGS